MSEYLAAEFPGSNEGGLSKLKAHLVSEASLAKAARRMKLGRLLRLGKGEELSKGREKHSLLADALEALIAAVYLDGDLRPAGRLRCGCWRTSCRQPVRNRPVRGWKTTKRNYRNCVRSDLRVCRSMRRSGVGSRSRKGV